MSVKESLDNPIIFLLLIALAVTAIQAIGRYIGAATNNNGVNTFFGGTGTNG